MERVVYRRLPLAAFLAAMVGVAGNALLFFVGKAFGAFPDTILIPQAGRPLSIEPVAVSTVAGVLGATAVYALIGRLVRRKAVTLFRWLALAVLLLSFATPFSVPSSTPVFVLTLELMHIVAAAATVGFLTSVGASRQDPTMEGDMAERTQQG